MTWDGKERSELFEIKLQLQKLNQSIKDNIVPLLNKHDDCLYGKDGNNGMVKEQTEIKTALVVMRIIGLGAMALLTLVFSILEVLR